MTNPLFYPLLGVLGYIFLATLRTTVKEYRRLPTTMRRPLNFIRLFFAILFWGFWL